MSCTFNTNTTVNVDGKIHSQNLAKEKQKTSITSTLLGSKFIDIPSLSNQWKERVVPELREMKRDALHQMVWITAMIAGGVALGILEKAIEAVMPVTCGALYPLSDAERQSLASQYPLNVVQTFASQDPNVKDYARVIGISIGLPVVMPVITSKKYEFKLLGPLSGLAASIVLLSAFPSITTVATLTCSMPTGAVIQGIIERKCFRKKQSEGKNSTGHKNDVTSSNSTSSPAQATIHKIEANSSNVKSEVAQKTIHKVEVTPSDSSTDTVHATVHKFEINPSNAKGETTQASTDETKNIDVRT